MLRFERVARDTKQPKKGNKRTADAPRDRALFARRRRLVGLALDAQVHDVISADRAVVHDDICTCTQRGAKHQKQRAQKHAPQDQSATAFHFLISKRFSSPAAEAAAGAGGGATAAASGAFISSSIGSLLGSSSRSALLAFCALVLCMKGKKKDPHTLNPAGTYRKPRKFIKMWHAIAIVMYSPPSAATRLDRTDTQNMAATTSTTSSSTKQPLLLDGISLCAEDLVELSRGETKIALSADAWERVARGREVVDNILKDSTRVAYGINTGFGLFSNVVISPDKLTELQENLIRSHSSGTGEPLTPSQTRMLLALRINVLSKGHSGIRVETLQQLIDAFNHDCLSVVPAKGTVGASGDLAPLAHLALGMMGEGKMWDKVVDANGATRFEIADSAAVLAKNGLRPVQLGAKEGLAMINGTQLITCIGAEAVVRAENAAKCADIAVSLSLEVLMGTVNAFHPRIHEARPHAGQQLVAARIRTLLQADEPSELFRSHNYVGKVQDAYTLRCAPQIHGVVHDTLQFVKNIINVEMNSATDNPMVFTGSAEVTTDFNPHPSSSEEDEDNAPVDAEELTDLSEAKKEIARLNKVVQDQKDHQASGLKRTTDTFYRGGGGFIISGGNFHGEYPAKALDFLAIAIHEIASVSERRIERLVNPSLSNLPAFLVKEGGLNSGFMIAHCTAAALVSENKVLTHPSSVDSISTSGGKEDHVSMGGFAARKALTVVEHVETVVAIEILAACQALDLLRPLRTTAPLEALHALVRTRVAPLDKDRFMKPDIDAVIELVQSGQVFDVVQPFLENMHVGRL